MAHIFLSYSRRDSEFVDRIAADLQKMGFRTWVDRSGIAGGDQWRKEIVGAIHSASVFVLFLSPNSARSDNVRKELDLADTAKVSILPVTISQTAVPSAIQYQLAGLQMVELWRAQDKALLLLLAGLKRHGVVREGAHGGKPPAPAPPAKRKDEVDLSGLGGGQIIDNGIKNFGRFFGLKR